MSLVLPVVQVTIFIFLSTLMTLNNLERVALTISVFIICFISPYMKWKRQRYKRIISGPWDIVHVTKGYDIVVN